MFEDYVHKNRGFFREVGVDPMERRDRIENGELGVKTAVSALASSFEKLPEFDDQLNFNIHNLMLYLDAAHDEIEGEPLTEAVYRPVLNEMYSPDVRKAYKDLVEESENTVTGWVFQEGLTKTEILKGPVKAYRDPEVEDFVFETLDSLEERLERRSLDLETVIRGSDYHQDYVIGEPVEINGSVESNSEIVF